MTDQTRERGAWGTILLDQRIWWFALVCVACMDVRCSEQQHQRCIKECYPYGTGMTYVSCNGYSTDCACSTPDDIAKEILTASPSGDVPQAIQEKGKEK